jgi:hypothetical protein
MMQIDQTKMQEVIQEAFDMVTGKLRWQTAIAKAKEQFETNPYMHFDGHSLLILSPSCEIYEANSTCTCKAFLNGNPCWHRAAARLFVLYLKMKPLESVF